MDPYKKFIQTEYENMRFLSFVPQKKYQPQIDLRMTSLSKENVNQVPIIRPPPESENQMIIYKPYTEDIHLLTTQLPPLLPQSKKQIQTTHKFQNNSIEKHNTNLSESELEKLNSLIIPTNDNRDKKYQTGSTDSFSLLPKSNTYTERTTKSTTYETDIKRHYINIDTRFRNNPTLTSSTNFRWGLYRPIRNAISLRVASIEIPNNFYTFSAARKNIEFSAKLTTSPSYTNFQIDPGNYIVSDMITMFQDLLNTLDPNFTVDISLVTGKMTISNPVSNFDIQFPKDEVKYLFGWGLGYYLGFNESSYTNQQSLVSERVVDLLGENYIFLQIGDYQGVYHEVEKQGLITATAKIILNSDKFQILFDNGSNFISKEVCFPMPTDISSFNVRLIDSNNNDIDMNGTNYSFTLEIVEIVNSRLYSKYSDNLLQNSDTPR